MNYISQQEPNQMWIKKVLMLVLADILIVLISYFMALLLRFDFVFSSIPEDLQNSFWMMGLSVCWLRMHMTLSIVPHR